MEVQVTNKPEESKAEITISVPAGDVASFIKKAAEAISKEKPLKGFRPGKAPVKMVTDTFGVEPVLQEALQHAVPHFFVQAVIDNDIEAISRPAVAISESSIDGPLKFIATVDVLPEVTLGDPKKIKTESRKVETSDEDVEKEIQYLAKSRSSMLDVARAAQEGDTVNVDFTIRVNGDVIEGGESKNHPVPLGEGHFLPDFEKGIVGMSAGDTRTFPVSFPDDYPKEDLRSAKAEATVVAHAVQQRVLPKIDDDFAKSIGSFESLSDLKEKLKKNMLEEKEHHEKERMLGEVAEKFTALTTIKAIPKELVDRDIDSRLTELAQMLQVQGKTLQDYLMGQKKSLDQVREDMRETAEKNVRIGLTLREFAKQNNVEVTDEEVEGEIKKQLAHYPSAEEAAKHVDLEHLKEHTISQLKNRKTLEKLVELSK